MSKKSCNFAKYLVSIPKTNDIIISPLHTHSESTAVGFPKRPTAQLKSFQIDIKGASYSSDKSRSFVCLSDSKLQG